jgi:hypothetical protein
VAVRGENVAPVPEVTMKELLHGAAWIAAVGAPSAVGFVNHHAVTKFVLSIFS